MSCPDMGSGDWDSDSWDYGYGGDYGYGDYDYYGGYNSTDYGYGGGYGGSYGGYGDFDEEAVIAETFTMIDSNGDGHISAPEVVSIMAEFGEEITWNEAYEIIEEADTDGDWEINFNEFYNMWTS